ncbi:hypothetical protein STFE110948_05875 [Streptobacillus felis]
MPKFICLKCNTKMGCTRGNPGRYACRQGGYCEWMEIE